VFKEAEESLKKMEEERISDVLEVKDIVNKYLNHSIWFKELPLEKKSIVYHAMNLTKDKALKVERERIGNMLREFRPLLVGSGGKYKKILLEYLDKILKDI